MEMTKTAQGGQVELEHRTDEQAEEARAILKHLICEIGVPTYHVAGILNIPRVIISRFVNEQSFTTPWLVEEVLRWKDLLEEIGKEYLCRNCPLRGKKANRELRDLHEAIKALEDLLSTKE